MAGDPFPDLPDIAFIGKRRSRSLQKKYEAARRAWKVEHPDVPREILEKTDVRGS